MDSEQPAASVHGKDLSRVELAKCCTGDLCEDFTQNTTLHGLRYVWLPGTTAIRRVIWFLLVAGCMTLSSYQILDRILYFYSLPVNVNVKVNFNDSLIFPTVTICNQNAFRATRAEELGYYNMLSEMYTGLKSFKSSRLKRYNATKMTLNDLFDGTAHRKEDMIIGCTWNGASCGPDNFTERMTDHGMCYSFNHPVNDTVDIKRILAPGENRGLTLILNAEYYENMPGPHAAVGIKVLVHDHKHYPKVTDLGIALPIGRNSFVAMKLTEVQNLPKPHGVCSSPKLDYFMDYSQQSCEIECITKDLAEKCGCRLHYMPYDKESPGVCTLPQYLDCYLSRPERHRQIIHKRCDCPEPCEFKIFDPTVSYAHISNFVISNFINTSKSDLEVKYQRAREISGRQQDERIPLIKAVENLENQTEECDKDIKLLKLATVLARNSSQIRSNETEQDFIRAQRFYSTQVDNFEQIISEGWEPLSEDLFSFLAQDTGEYLTTIETRLKQLVDPEHKDPSLRKMLYLLTGNLLDTRLDTAKRMKHNITKILTNTTTFFSGFLHNTSELDSNLLANYLRAQLSSSLDEMNSAFNEDIDDLCQWMSSYREILDEAFVENKLDITSMHQARDHYLKSLKTVREERNTIFQKIFQKPLQGVQEKHHHILKQHGEFKEYETNLYINLGEMNETLTLISEDLNASREKIVACQEYLSGNTSKLHVAKLFFSGRSDQEISSLKVNLDRFQTVRSDFEGIVDRITKAHYELRKTIVSDNDYVSYMASINETLNERFASSEELRSIYQFKYPLDEDHPLLNTRESLLQAIEVLTQLMEEYVETSEVDVDVIRDNLLHVDFFYREMSYESITQQVGYDIFALLCDIGGSMGLFIGGSVLTVFEVIDLFINLTLANFAGRRKITNNR